MTNFNNSSRYLTSPTAVLPDKSGRARQVVVGTPQANYTFTYVTYMIVAGDRIDNLAASFYGDSQKWWAFADANPEILDWSDLEPGVIIRVPNIPS